MGSWSQSIVESKDQRVVAEQGSFVVAPEATYQNIETTTITNAMPEEVARMLDKALDMGHDAISSFATVNQSAVDDLEQELSDKFAEVQNLVTSPNAKFPIYALVVLAGGIAYLFWKNRK